MMPATITKDPFMRSTEVISDDAEDDLTRLRIDLDGDGKNVIDVSVRDRGKDGMKVEVMSVNGHLNITPRSGNVIDVDAIDRRYAHGH